MSGGRAEDLARRYDDDGQGFNREGALFRAALTG
jgi:hypothetical protein